TVAANDGWTLGVSGSVNQFITYVDNNGAGGDSVANLQDGLLPAFLSFDMTAPTMNGLDIAAHISISPSTNNNSYAAMEQREVYFTVAGGFGQILAGKALGLYGSHNILTDQTLFGVGYGAGGNPEGSTTLGGIGLGYDYASWRSQVKWTSVDMNGFKLAIAIVDPAVGTFGGSTGLSGKPTGSITTGNVDSDSLRYEADLSYAGAFDGGSYTAWLSGMTQSADNANDNDTQAYTVGGTLKVAGFEAMAQYSDAESKAGAVAPAAAVAATPGNVGSAEVLAAPATTTEWSQYLVQAGYRFGGTTLVSAQYAELEDKNLAANDTIDKMTFGVYHDVNANLKLVAEYTQVEDDAANGIDQDIISLGGFVFF
ncbi:MAG: porin, partial [Pseudomonadota bacterium]|nr:porin [Pseudomonadota bacterium]